MKHIFKFENFYIPNLDSEIDDQDYLNSKKSTESEIPKFKESRKRLPKKAKNLLRKFKSVS